MIHTYILTYIYKHTHTHTHTYIYIYIYIFICEFFEAIFENNKKIINKNNITKVKNTTQHNTKHKPTNQNNKPKTDTTTITN